MISDQGQDGLFTQRSLPSLIYFLYDFRLGTGWSVHTEKFTKFNKGDQLSMEEQDHIMNVISKAEYLDQVEQERIG